MILTKIIFDPDTFLCYPSSEKVDEDVINEIFYHRFDICNFCEELNQREVTVNDASVLISCCGCCPIDHKWKIVYPKDDNGNVFEYTTKDGKFGYVCKLKKW